MLVFFFFKQKTAYEMRISDWSSDVCSSDLFGQETSLNNADNAAAMARQGSANAAAMARQMTTEAAARGGAFRNLPVEQQALAVGPSAEEAKGGWIAAILLRRRPMASGRACGRGGGWHGR